MKKLIAKWTPLIREAAGAVGEKGQAKFREYAPQAVAAVKGLTEETRDLTGEERKKAMKKLVMAKIRMPFFVRWTLSPLAGRAVGVIVEFADLHDCIRSADSTPEKRHEAGAAILDRLGTPFYLKWAAKPIIGCALDVATEYRDLLGFAQFTEATSPTAEHLQNSLAEQTIPKNPADGALQDFSDERNAIPDAHR